LDSIVFMMSPMKVIEEANEIRNICTGRC